jgi:hypothetical protein
METQIEQTIKTAIEKANQYLKEGSHSSIQLYLQMVQSIETLFGVYQSLKLPLLSNYTGSKTTTTADGTFPIHQSASQK